MALVDHPAQVELLGPVVLAALQRRCLLPELVEQGMAEQRKHLGLVGPVLAP